MAKWGVTANKGAASVKSVLVLTAAAANMRRAKVADLMLGCDASPADAAFVYIGQRCTTAATGAALTPNSTDPADSLACTIVAQDTVTADPTLTAAAFPFPGVAVNQRSVLRWAAQPGYELVIPATATNGIMFGVKSATTTSFQFGAQFEEQ